MFACVGWAIIQRNVRANRSASGKLYHRRQVTWEEFFLSSVVWTPLLQLSWNHCGWALNAEFMDSSSSGDSIEEPEMRPPASTLDLKAVILTVSVIGAGCLPFRGNGESAI